MELLINGQKVNVDAESGELLLWVLRDKLEMTGTKFGCGAGICGACTVHVDGEATRACITPIASVAGRDIRTIEGLAENGELHPMQQAFIDGQVPQCGWCMSGQIMTAAAFVAIRISPGLSNSPVAVALSVTVRHCLTNQLHSSFVARFASCMILSPHFIRSPIALIVGFVASSSS